MLTRRRFLGTVGAGLVAGPQVMAAETAPVRRTLLLLISNCHRSFDREDSGVDRGIRNGSDRTVFDVGR
jgi:hypothetical protein